jgi:hypothetical protein
VWFWVPVILQVWWPGMLKNGTKHLTKLYPALPQPDGAVFCVLQDCCTPHAALLQVKSQAPNYAGTADRKHSQAASGFPWKGWC